MHAAETSIPALESREMLDDVYAELRRVIKTGVVEAIRQGSKCRSHPGAKHSRGIPTDPPSTISTVRPRPTRKRSR